MVILIVGLIAFLGLHSVRAVAEPWRTRQIAALGASRWRAVYSLLSLASFALLIWGFSRARAQTPVVWHPPLALHGITALLVLIAFVLVVAAYIPRNHLKALLGHPMTLGVKTWAFGHLLSAGSLADLLLFGGFLAWSVLVYAAARRRDRAAGKQPQSAVWSRDLLAVLVGAVAWFVFAHWLHEPLIGVRPLG